MSGISGSGPLQPPLEQTPDVALAAFVALTEAIGTETDLDRLATHAIDVLERFIPGLVSTYYDFQESCWSARVVGAHVGPELAALLRAGLPLDTPAFAQAAEFRRPVFIDGWDAASQRIEQTAEIGAGALYPYFDDGRPYGMLTAGTLQARAWTALEHTLFLAVGRSLGMAIERTNQLRRLLDQRQEAERQAQALTAFARLTADLSVQIDPYALIHRAQQVALSLLPSGYALYYERDADRWRNRVQVGEVGSIELQAFIDAGPLVGQTPSVDHPWTTGQAFYQDVYAQGSDTPAEMVRHVWAAASLPVIRDGQVVGVFIAVLFDQRTWTGADRVVLETVVGSLGLALARSVQTQALEGERAGLDAFAAFTEAVGSETEELALARQAVQVVRASVEQASFVYYELEGDRWTALAWSDDIPADVVAELRAGLPTDTPNFARAAHSGEPVFVGGWDASEDNLPSATAYRAAAFLPVTVQGEARRFVTAGIRGVRMWTPRDQRVIRAVVRGLTLALERTEQARQLQAQRDALDARTASLAAANEALEAFTYSASHDLRTPVRHVAGFTELAQKALQKTPNPQAQHHLEMISQGAMRMTALIDGMLTLSRIGQEQLRPQWVDLERLVTQARRDVGTEFGLQAVRWQIQTLPPVWGSADLLQQVMTNLMSNAVKYSGQQDVAEINVRVHDRDGEWTISVQDNGVGFNPAYASRLFGVFQRLHSDKEFKGTGVGLAIVQRIVMKHGGRVFAESADESGATFGFTLPKPSQEDSAVG